MTDDSHPGLTAGPMPGSAATLADLPNRDGRFRRSDRTKTASVAATRALMAEGVFQPTIIAICGRARCSIRSAFTHFGALERLHAVALECPTTRAHILTAVCGQAALEVPVAERIVRAVVLGRVEA